MEKLKSMIISIIGEMHWSSIIRLSIHGAVLIPLCMMHVKRAGGAWKRIKAQLPGTGRLSTTNTKSNSGVSQYSLCYSYQWEHQPPKQYLWYVYFNFDNFGSLPSSRCSAPWSAKSSIPPILPISSRESLSPPVLSLRLLTLSLPRSNTTIYVRLSLRSRGTISWGAQISSLKPTRLDCFCKLRSRRKLYNVFCILKAPTKRHLIIPRLHITQWQ